MNEKDDNSQHTDDYRSLLLLDEISQNEALTQRDLSKKLGVALGLVNSYIKNLASKGYITVSAIPKKRYKYYLTPTGFAEKTRLTYHHLQNFTNLYRVARRDFGALFSGLSPKYRTIAFCGVDEIAEIAYLSLTETKIELVAVLDDDREGERFFGKDIIAFKDVGSVECDLFVLTSFNKSRDVHEKLLTSGIDEGSICDISSEGWIKRLGGER